MTDPADSTGAGPDGPEAALSPASDVRRSVAELPPGFDRARYLPEPKHLQLGGAFFDAVAPADFPQTVLRYRNPRAAQSVGLAGLSDDQWRAHFGRFEPLPDNLTQPLALRYHGHQFRNYNPQLGDGRGFLFAQMRDADDGRLLDLGTKGSGRTPWSRTADGRLTLKGGVREVLATALLEQRGVYTSKTFSLIETGEKLERHDEPSPTRSAVMVRLSHGHIRFGSFQRLRALNDTENLERLVDYSLATYLGGAAEGDIVTRCHTLLARVTANCARLVAGWQAAGFVHGVLNTDNMNITGESFDYGPFRFLPEYIPGFTAAYFDQQGLYCYARQPEAVAWNLERLAEALLPLIVDVEKATEPLLNYGALFQQELRDAMFRRLRVETSDDLNADLDVVNRVFGHLKDSGLSWDRFFHEAATGRLPESAERDLFAGHRRPVTPDQPYLSLVYEETERLWAAIDAHDDWAPLHAVLAQIEAATEAGL